MDQKTIDTYNKMAKEYDDETIDFWDRFPRTFINKFAELTKGKVIDIGSGPGRDGLLLKEQGLEVICLDASQAMINLCEQKGLESVLGDFMAMPFDNNSFDGAWAYTSLLHIPKKDISKAFNEIHRVLKNDGVLGLGLIEGDTEGHRESFGARENKGYKEGSGLNMPRYFSFYTEDEINKILKNHGFKILYFEKIKPGSKNYLYFIAQKQGYISNLF